MTTNTKFSKFTTFFQVVIKKMLAENRTGSIVNVSSQASMRALPDHTTYGSSKAAVDQVFIQTQKHILDSGNTKRSVDVQDQMNHQKSNKNNFFKSHR
jgi:short-subunit dehydrogenase